MRTDWYRRTIIYSVDPFHFQDGNGDGIGDLPGVIKRLPYLRSLGVTCLWLAPFYPTPMRDGGYDVSDYLSVDPRFGTLSDVAELFEAAEDLGIRVMVELIVHHTSDQHPWFQEARRDKNSRYRDFYVWADEPAPTEHKPIFPTVEDSVWRWDEEAGQYYRHIFYRHQPDLNMANPAVREEIRRVMAFWLRMGVAGFRVDAASHMIEGAREDDPREDGFWFLEELHDYVRAWRRDGVLFGEVDVPPQEYEKYFGEGRRLTLVSNFWLNNYLYLALARGKAEPLCRALNEQPKAPPNAEYVVWVRNHDELDLERLTDKEREEVLQRFAPHENMRIYHRGIRRRIAPMLDGNIDWIALAHAVVMSMPGVPILRYGDEIGMGDDLSLKERLAVRTAMQWSDEENAGFSNAPPEDLACPLISEGQYSYKQVNVYHQMLDERSLLSRLGKMIRTRIGLPALGSGQYRVLEADHPAVLAVQHDTDDPGDTVVCLANMSDELVHVRVHDMAAERFVDVLCDGPYDSRETQSGAVTLHPYGYRWLLRRLVTR